MRLNALAFLAALSLGCTTSVLAQIQYGPATITIDASAPRVTISPDLYGAFYEEINHAGEGGLYAEMIQNRDFEANTIPPGWHVDGDTVTNPQGWKTKKWFDSDLPGWSMVREGDADGSIRQDSKLPLSENNPHSMCLTVTKMGERCGVANSGFWGMNVQAGQWYDATFYARTEGDVHTGLCFSLESSDGSKTYTRCTIPEVGGQWTKYSVSLQSRGTDPTARLVIAPIEPSTTWFDCVSLFPRKTFKDRAGGLRTDLAQMLADLKPGFLRYPGGCVVEGVTLQNRFRWADSIGDISQRTGGFDLWGYYNTYGLGFEEYLQLTEDLGSNGIYVINSGTSCQAKSRQPPEVSSDTDLPKYVQDSMDALEYALGPATSTQGTKRAANGHPEPFKIKYVEIGNENHGPDYARHYKAYYDAIKAKYPGIITIANERLTDSPMEFVDDHFYVTPEKFFQMADYYDKVDRSGPKIYVGEYAVNKNVGSGDLLGALAEAVFMLNMEKNSDLVKMCSYAPLFENVNDRRWPVNLIRFDSSRAVGRSSYYVQKLFAENRPDVALQTKVDAGIYTLPASAPPSAMSANAAPVLPSSATEPSEPVQISRLYALSGLDQTYHELVIKVVNATPEAVTSHITIKSLKTVAGNSGTDAKVFTISDPDPTAENTLEAPMRVIPVESHLPIAGPDFSATFAANSLTVLRVPAE